MKKWIIDCSIDGDLVDYSEIVESETEPEFWEQYAIAEKHGCEGLLVTNWRINK